MHFSRYPLVAAAALSLVVSLSAQDAPKDTKSDSPKAFAALKYRSIGPAAGGRVARAAGVPGNPLLYYAATASGGVWMSDDGGTHWKSIFDDEPVSSIGSIAIASSDPNVIYVGSGEANIRGNVGDGNGIYRSVDGGKTWTHVWTQKGQIGTMAVDPHDANVAFAAVLGDTWAPNPERGVYRTRDGGKTWQQVLKKDADTGCSDIAIDPQTPAIVFAGFWQARRFPWDLHSGGPGSGLYVSHDGGDTWKQLTGHGLPGGIWGKVGVAVAPSDGDRVYALIEADAGGLYRSDDGGDSWELENPSRALRQRAWYYSTITVNPVDEKDVWFPQVPMLRSIDGGKTIDEVKGVPHGDNHDIWIDPKNPQRMIVSNDGGVHISRNGGKTWFTPPLPIAQFYHVSADNRRPYWVAGSMQDLGTAQGPSNSLTGNIALSDWHDVGGGEAGWVVSDPADPNIVYGGEYLGIFTRYDFRTRESRNVSAWPENPSGHGAEDMRYRFQWTAPIAMSPFDPSTMYHGANVIFRTRDGGQRWDVISPDLTRNDKSKQKWAGGPITGDNTGVETYDTVFVIAESPKQRGVIWAGSDDGLVHVTSDDGKSWTNVTAAMPGFPEWGTVSMIEPSPFDAGTAYVTVDAHRLNDTRPYLYKTADLGKTWKRLDAGLAQDVYLHSIREDPKKRGQLYLATERGVMFSTNDGQTWQSLQLNLPAAIEVTDAIVKDDNLVLSTMGRSLWILDDLQPVREYTDQIGAEPLHLFAPADGILWRYGSGDYGVRLGSFPNPPNGASIYYSLAHDANGEVRLEVRDARNQLVRTLSTTPRERMNASDFEEKPKAELSKDAGVQRAIWNLRYDGARMIKNGKIDEGDPSEGPRVPPGVYTVKVTADGASQSAQIRVLPDPRGDLPQADLEAQAAFGLRVRDDVSRLTDLVNQLRLVRDQLKARNAALESHKAEPDAAALIKDSNAVIAKIDALEDKLHNPTAEVVYDILAMKGGTRLYSRLSPLMSWAVESEGVPTQGMTQVLSEQETELSQLGEDEQGLLLRDVGSLNQRAAKLNLPFVVIK